MSQELSRVAPIFVSTHPNAGLPNEFGGYDETPGAHGRHAPRICRERPGQHRGWLLRHDSGAHQGHCGCGRGTAAAAPPASPPSPAPAQRTRAAHVGPDTLFVNVGERTNVTGSRQVRQADSGRQLRGGAGGGAAAGGERRADDRREHGRGNARFPAGHGARSCS